MIKFLAFFQQNDMNDYNEKLGEWVGGVVFVLLVIMLVGWIISKYAKKT